MLHVLNLPKGCQLYLHDLFLGLGSTVVKLKTGYTVGQLLQLEGELKGAGLPKFGYPYTFTMTVHGQHVNVDICLAASIQCLQPNT